MKEEKIKLTQKTIWFIKDILGDCYRNVERIKEDIDQITELLDEVLTDLE